MTLLFVALDSSAHAQEEGFDLHVETILGYSTNYIHEDRNGFIWLSSSANVIRYDGATRHVYRHVPFDTTTIDNGNYFAIASGADGSIWFDTAVAGLNRMNGYGGRIDRWGVRVTNEIAHASSGVEPVSRPRKTQPHWLMPGWARPTRI